MENFTIEAVREITEILKKYQLAGYAIVGQCEANKIERINCAFNFPEGKTFLSAEEISFGGSEGKIALGLKLNSTKDMGTDKDFENKTELSWKILATFEESCNRTGEVFGKMKSLLENELNNILSEINKEPD